LIISHLFLLFGRRWTMAAARQECGRLLFQPVKPAFSPALPGAGPPTPFWAQSPHE